MNGASADSASTCTLRAPVAAGRSASRSDSSRRPLTPAAQSRFSAFGQRLPSQASALRTSAVGDPDAKRYWRVSDSPPPPTGGMSSVQATVRVADSGPCASMRANRTVAGTDAVAPSISARGGKPVAIRLPSAPRTSANSVPAAGSTTKRAAPVSIM